MNKLDDHSPYYTSFRDNNFNKIIELASSLETNDWIRENRFSHQLLPTELANEILDIVPYAEELKLIRGRASLFISQPGIYYRAHKDGINLKFGVNFPIVIRDSLAITRWYDDSVEKDYNIDMLGGRSRELNAFKPKNHIPLHTMSMTPDAAILFNTEIYHDWTNVQSKNVRVILALRSSDANMTYDIAKTILFK